MNFIYTLCKFLSPQDNPESHYSFLPSILKFRILLKATNPLLYSGTKEQQFWNELLSYQNNMLLSSFSRQSWEMQIVTTPSVHVCINFHIQSSILLLTSDGDTTIEFLIFLFITLFLLVGMSIFIIHYIFYTNIDVK